MEYTVLMAVVPWVAFQRFVEPSLCRLRRLLIELYIAEARLGFDVKGEFRCALMKDR